MASYWRLRPGAPKPGTIVGPLAEVPEGYAREYRFGRGLSAFRMIVARHRGLVHAYLNLCPHMSLPLNDFADTHITADGQLLVCTRHFAQFDMQTGVCVAGACLGSELDRIAIHVDEDHNIKIG